MNSFSPAATEQARARPRPRARRFAPMTVLAAAAVALTGCTTLGNSGEDDRITEYLVDAEIDGRGSVAVTETITYDFADEPSPGLFREMPVTVEQDDGTHRPVQVEGVEVASPSGAPAGIRESSTSNGWYTLRVGDTGQQVTGEQTYELSYTLDGAVAEDEQGRPELYWDFIGTGWSVPIDSARVTVDAPGIAEVECAVGNEDTERDCGTSGHGGGQAEFSDEDLQSGQALTAAVRMPEGAAETSDATTSAPLPRWLTLSGTAWLVGLTAAGVVLLGLRGLWDRRVRNKALRERPAGIPPQLSAAAAGFLQRGKLHPAHVLAALVEMEEKGLVVSRPHPTRLGDYCFEPGYTPAAPPTEAEQALLMAMFQYDNRPVDLDAFGDRLTPAKGRTLSEKLRKEGYHLGLYVPAGRHTVQALLGLPLLIAAFLAPPWLNDTFHLGLERLTAIGMVVLGLCVFGALLPTGLTGAGQNVRQELTRAKQSPVGLRPALLLALGGQVPLPPGMHNMRPAFYHDEAFRTRWNSRLGRTMYPSSGSGGGSGGGGGFSAGGGGGGGGGGRG